MSVISQSHTCGLWAVDYKQFRLNFVSEGLEMYLDISIFWQVWSMFHINYKAPPYMQLAIRILSPLNKLYFEFRYKWLKIC